MTKTKANTEARIPTLEETSPAYVTAKAKLQEMFNLEKKLERESSGIGIITNETEAERQGEAQAYLESGVFPDGQEQEARRGRQHKAGGELRILRRAIEMQKATVQKHAAEASRKICDQVRPRHRAIVQELAKAVLKVLQGNEEHVRLLDELGNAGVMKDFPNAAVYLIGELRDSQASGCKYIRELVAVGLLDPKDPVVRTLDMAHEDQPVR
jgi:hypothetical protein